jgi:hypothetical protein
MTIDNVPTAAPSVFDAGLPPRSFHNPVVCHARPDSHAPNATNSRLGCSRQFP